MIEKRERRGRDGKTYTVYRVRWRDDRGRGRSRTLPRGTKRKQAEDFERRVITLKRGGNLDELDLGREPLVDFVEHWWHVYAGPNLERSTLVRYAQVWNKHANPHLGELRLRELSPALLANFRATLERDGVGAATIRKTLTMLQGILARAVEEGRIASNPVSVVRKPSAKRRREIVVVPPEKVEQLRRNILDTDREHRGDRDATLISVLAYAGLRPWSEAIALPWAKVRDRTLLVYAPKTRRARSVDLLAPLKNDLAEWRGASDETPDEELVFPGPRGTAWSDSDVRNWRKRIWREAIGDVGLPKTMIPYDLRHCFASLLLHEGRLSLIEITEQLGHSLTMLSSTYAHVIAELKDSDRISAEEQIRRARAKVWDGSMRPTK
jgi:integrase